MEQLLTDDLLETLLLWGYLYEVDDTLRITDKPTTTSDVVESRNEFYGS